MTQKLHKFAKKVLSGGIYSTILTSFGPIKKLVTSKWITICVKSFKNAEIDAHILALPHTCKFIYLYAYQ